MGLGLESPHDDAGGRGFNDALSVLSEHIAQASQFWFAGSTINELSKRPEVVQAIQRAPGFWVCARRALEDQARQDIRPPRGQPDEH